MWVESTINMESKRKYKRLRSCHFPVEWSLLMKTCSNFTQDWGEAQCSEYACGHTYHTNIYRGLEAIC